MDPDPFSPEPIVAIVEAAAQRRGAHEYAVEITDGTATHREIVRANERLEAAFKVGLAIPEAEKDCWAITDVTRID